jgi:hypothetical protein
MRKTVINVVIIVLFGAILAVAAIVYQTSRKEALGKALLGEFKEDLTRMPMDGPVRSYVEGLADAFHDEAYERSFGADAPALGGTTDVTLYQRTLLTSMLAQAMQDGRKEAVKALEDYRDTVATLELHEHGGGG